MSPAANRGGRIEREKEKTRRSGGCNRRKKRARERKNRVWERIPGEEREERRDGKREGIKEREEREG